MDENILLCTESTYNIIEFKHLHECILFESECFDTKILMIEYADNSLIESCLLEDAQAIKNTIVETVMKLIELIKKLSVKFQNMALSLTTTNAKWLESLKLLTLDNISADFKYDMFPYWNASSLITSVRIPEFEENNEEFIALLSNQDDFRTKYFKPFYATVDGKGTYNPKVALQGGKAEKITIDAKTFVSKMDDMVKFIADYNKNAKNVVSINNKIMSVLQRGVSKIKGTPITESINIIESTILSLLEADDPVTSTDIKTEDKDAPGTSSSKADDKESDDKKSTTGVKNIANERQTYAKLCYEVTSAQMNMMEAYYNSAVKCIMSAKKSSKTSTKEKPKEDADKK